MRNFIMAVIGLIFILPSNSNPNATNELKSLKSVCPTSGSNEEAKKLGLSEDVLRSTIFVGLKRDLPQLEIHVQCNNNEDGLLAVSVQALQTRNKGGGTTGLATYVTLILSRGAMILSGTSQNVGFTIAEVWRVAALLSGSEEGYADQVTEALREFETKFSAAYYRDN